MIVPAQNSFLFNKQNICNLGRRTFKFPFCLAVLCPFLVLAGGGLTSCSSTKKAATLAKCTFTVRSVDHINVAGVDIGALANLSTLSFLDAGPLLAALSKPELPMNMVVNVEGHNPNEGDAGIHRLDWVLFIDDLEITSGSVEQPVRIPGRGSVIVEVPVTVDLKKVLSGKSLGAIVNFATNLGGTGTKPSDVEIRLKPVISVGGVSLKYPGYITVRSEVGRIK